MVSRPLAFQAKSSSSPPRLFVSHTNLLVFYHFLLSNANLVVVVYVDMSLAHVSDGSSTTIGAAFKQRDGSSTTIGAAFEQRAPFGRVSIGATAGSIGGGYWLGGGSRVAVI